jgi:hypothetical protein
MSIKPYQQGYQGFDPQPDVISLEKADFQYQTVKLPVVKPPHEGDLTVKGISIAYFVG